jgi:hypothetical protein
MIFSSHPKFDKELGTFLKKHHKDDGWLFKLQNLLTSNYEKRTVNLSQEVIPPVGAYEGYKVHKVHMVIGGISKNDRPRVCFAIKDSTIIFLCFGTHIDNYKNSVLVAIAIERIKEFIGA